MRRRRQVLTTGTTEVSEAEAEPQPRSGGIPLAHAWAPSDVIVTLPEGGSGADNDMEPALKRFKLPDKLLTRLGRTPEASERNTKAVSAENDLAAVIHSKRVAAEKYHTSANNDAAGDDSRPLVSVRRLSRQPRPHEQEQQRRGAATAPYELFGNSNDDVIRFGTKWRVEDSESSSTGSSWSEENTQRNADTADARAEKRRREIDRHFSGYGSDDLDSSSDSLSAGEEGEEEEISEGEDTEHDDGDEVEEDDNNGNDNNTPIKNGEHAGFGLLERRREQQQRQEQQRQQEQHQARNPETTYDEKAECVVTNHTRDHRYRYSSMFYEMHAGHEGVSPCHHTLLSLKGPITVQGPCGIIGFGIGEVAVGGFFLGKKQVMLFTDAERVVVTPVQRLKSKSAGLESLPVPMPVSCKMASYPFTVIPPTVREICGDAADNNDVELFGTIDWVWVEATIASWQGRFANNVPNIVLVVQAYDPCGVPPTRRHRLKGKEEHLTNAFMDVPRFVARGHDTGIDAALLPEVVPMIVKQSPGAVVVLGSQNIGKSTLARFLANALFSQHGICYWLDLDLGQPEFSPPGVVSLYCVQQPLLRPRDTTKVKLVQSFFLGGSRPRCPRATAIAIEQICAIAEPLQRRHPVVVNTHGWVLSTGRRMTVEAIRRLRPKHIVHLVKEGETRWARDSELLMTPTNGLNSEVLHKRFLVRRAALAGAEGKANDVIGRLPFPHPAVNRREATTTTGWCATVHTVTVTRNEGSPQQCAQPKPSAVRCAIWQQHLAPLFRYYETLEEQRWRTDATLSLLGEETDTTTLFKGLLRQFDAIVLADVADARELTDDVVCAALEHSVVALSFSLLPSSPPPAPAAQQEEEETVHKALSDNYRCLSGMDQRIFLSPALASLRAPRRRCWPRERCGSVCRTAAALCVRCCRRMTSRSGLASPSRARRPTAPTPRRWRRTFNAAMTVEKAASGGEGKKERKKEAMKGLREGGSEGMHAHNGAKYAFSTLAFLVCFVVSLCSHWEEEAGGDAAPIFSARCMKLSLLPSNNFHKHHHSNNNENKLNSLFALSRVIPLTRFHSARAPAAYSSFSLSMRCEITLPITPTHICIISESFFFCVCECVFCYFLSLCFVPPSTRGKKRWGGHACVCISTLQELCRTFNARSASYVQLCHAGVVEATTAAAGANSYVTAVIYFFGFAFRYLDARLLIHAF
ncbi:NUC156 family protein [Trypanosoma rangeli]|uniref:NUC156 family protein n=1 Tax=Trypanosoma rangeli TaxID=5698 RepID=A0A3S5IQL3_TRYRA|nr:NUC156 family protein [Trypanosoma rangeli]RNF00945.1 NUC156 family protein [Trypanosoma rangeli]|eukprot:RNF00945.1 NUC156 family protein [Trypanosoma rangeli]